MSVLPQLERELLAAHRRLGERGRWLSGLGLLGGGRVGGWLSSALGAAPLLLGLAATLAVVLIAVFTVGGGGAPSPHGAAPPPSGPPPPLFSGHPSRRQQKELVYLERAWRTVLRSDRGCRPGGPASPTVSQGSPDPGLLSALGVLRRPAQPSDRLPVRVTYHPYTRDPRGSLPSAHEIYVRYIRRARWRFGAGYYIVPAGVINPSRGLLTRCYVDLRDAISRKLATVPRPLRASTRALEPRYLASVRYEGSPHSGVCLLALNSTGNGDVGCGATMSDIELGHALQTGGPTGVGVVYGLVPDGVATVTLYYRGRYPGHPITVRNISNVFIAPDPRQHFPSDGFPYKVVWRSASGVVIKTITY